MSYGDGRLYGGLKIEKLEKLEAAYTPMLMDACKVKTMLKEHKNSNCRGLEA